MKIAILLLVHNNLKQTYRLIEHLSKDFDVYVHIDRKSDFTKKDFKGLPIFVFKKYRVYWGSYSQICAVIFLLKKAFKNGYDRYLLISASDIPLKSNQQIIEFFRNNTDEFIDYHQLPYSAWSNQNGGFKRIQLYHGINSRACNSFMDKVLAHYTGKIFSLYNRKFKVSRKFDHIFYGGINWFNLTHNCVHQTLEYLSLNKSYLKRFRYTLCADEIFFQTIICNYITDLKINNDSLRYIKWGDSEDSPNTLTLKDLPNILASDRLFARKFDENVDEHIIDVLYDRII